MSSEVQAKWMNSSALAVSGIAGKFIAQPVFDGFHIVIGAALDGFDLFCIGFGEMCGELIEMCDSGG